MATYKLLKKYPGSPELNTILLQIGDKFNNYWDCKNIGIDYKKNLIENNPEFWQKVEELEYEILSIIKKSDGTLFKVKNWDKDGAYLKYTDDYIFNPSKNSLEYILNNFIIHSVRRVRDNVTFSIGDLCNPIGEYSNNKHKITEIWFTNSGDLRISSDNYCLDINRIEHSKKVLFVTEDGVEIFKGDYYHSVNIDTYTLYEPESNGYASNKLIYKIFSTKEKAEEYVLYNKTMFSLQEILDIRQNYINAFDKNHDLKHLFINKAKEKQNGNT